MSQNYIKTISKFFRTFPRSQAKASVSEFHQSDFQLFRTFPPSQSKESVSKVHQVISKCSVRFLATNEERVSQNFIKVFFRFYAHFLAAN